MGGVGTFEGTFEENAQWRKVKHKCTWGRVGTFENAVEKGQT